MVKLDNWQTKAEKAAERRTLSKQRKKKKDDNRHFKEIAKKFVTYLAAHEGAIRKFLQGRDSATTTSNSSTSPQTVALHVWVEQCPLDHPFRSGISSEQIREENYFDHDDEQGTAKSRKNKNRRPRSNSDAVSPPTKEDERRQQRRNRSNSDASCYESASSPGKGARKQRGISGRPRSQSNALDYASAGGNVSRSDESFKVCARHFFRGDCPSADGKKGAGKFTKSSKVGGLWTCPRCWHGLHPTATMGNPTLCSIISPRTSSFDALTSPTITSVSQNQITNLHAARQALSRVKSSSDGSVEDMDTQNFGMDMFYHLQVPIPASDPGTSLAELLVSTLTDNGCSVSNIVYIGFDRLLVFDRYRNGKVLSNEEERLLLYGGSKRRAISFGDSSDYHRSSSSLTAASSRTGEDDDVDHPSASSIIQLHQHLVQALPGPILEYIIDFLPISAVALLPRVCRSWCQEIGKGSPDLWKKAMDRYSWPYNHLGSHESQSSPTSSIQLYRRAFEDHYLAVRDTNAVLHGIEKLFSSQESQTSRSNPSSDLVTYSFEDDPGTKAMRGSTVVRVWSNNRVLVGSREDCTLHVYDIVNVGDSPQKRFKLSLRVSVVPFARSKKRYCVLEDVALTDEYVICLYRVDSEDQNNCCSKDNWIGMLRRDDLLCARTRGAAVASLDENTIRAFNLTSRVLEFALNTDDVEMSTWLSNHVGPSGADPSTLFLTPTGTFVVWKDSSVLVQMYLFVAPAEDDGFSFPFLSKVFLVSFTGVISWISPMSSTFSGDSLKMLSKPQGVNGVEDVNQGPGNPRVGVPTAAFLASSSELILLTVGDQHPVSCESLPLGAHSSSSTLEILGIGPGQDLLLAQRWQSPGGPEGNIQRVTRETITPRNASSQSELFDEHAFLPVAYLGQSHLIAFGLHLAQPTGGRAAVFARLYDLHSEQVIHEVCSKDWFSNEVLQYSSSFFLDTYGDFVVASIDSIGVVAAGHGISTISSPAHERKSKRKKGARTTKGRKDVFARGMRQSMG